ncbi:MAG TPA: hypothetical protein VNZ03_33355 [Terriglobales bacterium]|nr:hypothetical protein [Terriglobales bacterium]
MNRHAKRPEHALIFRCATTGDEKQDLLFGAYTCARVKEGKYEAEEIGLFCRDGHPEELRVLQRFVKNSRYEMGTIEQFRRRVFLKYLKAGALIVAYDAPFEISRIAVKWNKSRKRRRAFAFYFRMFRDKKTGKMRPSGYEPGLSIESLDASKAIYRLIKYKFHDMDAEREKEQETSNAHVIDLKTLAAALTGEAYTFASACEIFSAPASRTRKVRPRVTKVAIERLLRDVTAELELLSRLKQELERHPFYLVPERAYSSATLAKGYFSAIGIKPPEKKFKIPDRINGIAMQAFVAGRAECTIRRTPVPVTYLDFHAQFPAVINLLDCREILCAESLEFADFTAEARQLLGHVKPDDCYCPAFWKRLRWFALVEPNEDVLPMRAKFGQREDSDPTLGWNFLTSKQPIWVTGLDAVAAKLMTGKPLKILKAIKVIPHGVQSGLAPVKLYGQLELDPRRDDLAVKLVELRASLKTKKPKLAGGLKVAANSAAFGILCQIDVTDLDSPSPLHVFSGEANYPTLPVKVWEQPAEFYSPVVASLVTGGSHLFCAMLECAVREMGGHIAAMDTDSAMIVSTRDGGLVPCGGGPERLEKYHAPGGNAAIHALSWAEVDRIRERFEALNPWRDTLKAPSLKLEEENFAPDGERQLLYAYCISAKLYCLYNLDGGKLLVRKPSGHGLGFLQAPYTIADWKRKTGRKWNEDLSPWVFEAWHHILSRELGLPHKPPSWLKQPAVMAVPITTPNVLSRLGSFKDDLRPFTVVTVPFPKRETVRDPLWRGYFITPQTEKLNDLHGRTMVNIVSGESFHIYDKNSSRLPKPPGWLSLKTMEDEINHILSRAETKFCAPNGGVCTSRTLGLLARRHIVAGEFHYIGKEASTRWAGGPDPSMLADAGALDPAEETCREYERVVDAKYLDQIRTEAKGFSTKRLARLSRLGECTIRNFKNGKGNVRPRSLRKLIVAIHDLQNKRVKN